MMGIGSMLIRNCNDVAVYWSVTGDDGYGKKIFAEPYEIACRWEEMQQVIVDDKGNQLTSRAVVYTLQDVDEEGMLYHGLLEDLYDNGESEGDISNPMEIDSAYIIKRFRKVPSLHSTSEFLRTAYLTPSLSFGGF